MSKSNKLCLPRVLAICLTAAAFIGLLPSAPSYGQSAIPENGKPKTDAMHVYLLRGLFNVFSLGMDSLGSKLRQRGIPASIDNHIMWRIRSDEAVEEYRRGRIRYIVIMGHSQGAINSIDMANRIANAGVPVSLVVTFDPGFKTAVSNNNVRWVVNLYMPGGIGSKVFTPDGYTGVVENIDLSNDPTDHMTLDKSDLLQERAINYALKAATPSGPPTQTAIPGASARAKAGNNRNGVRPQQQ